MLGSKHIHKSCHFKWQNNSAKLGLNIMRLQECRYLPSNPFTYYKIRICVFIATDIHPSTHLVPHPGQVEHLNLDPLYYVVYQAYVVNQPF